MPPDPYSILTCVLLLVGVGVYYSFRWTRPGARWPAGLWLFLGGIVSAVILGQLLLSREDGRSSDVITAAYFLSSFIIWSFAVLKPEFQARRGR